jgi:DNA processing protein
VQSGSLITARLAAEQGREVFAIPGSIHAPQSRGCHALIKQGVKLVETAQDVLDELPLAAAARTPERTPDPNPPAAAKAIAPDDPLLRALGHDPVTLDALSARTGLDTASLLARLLALELEGSVSRLPGGLYQRIARA